MAVKQGKPFRIRAERLNAAGECLVLLPAGFRNALLDAAQRFQWAATWIDDDENRTTLTAQQIETIEVGLWRLTDCMDIIVNNNLEVSNDCNNCTGAGSGSNGDDIGISVNCTDDGGATVNIPPGTPIDEPVTETAPYINPDNQEPPGEFKTWEEHSDYWCKFSYYVPELLGRQIEGLNAVKDRMVDVGTVLVLIAALFPQTQAAKASTAIIEIVFELLRLKAADVLGDILAWLSDYLTEPDNLDELACAIYSDRYNTRFARSAFIRNIVTVAESTFTTDTASTVEKLLNVVFPLAWLYGDAWSGALIGFYDELPDADCTSCQASGTIPNTFAVFPEFDYPPTWFGGRRRFRYSGGVWETDDGSPVPGYVQALGDLGGYGLAGLNPKDSNPNKQLQGSLRCVGGEDTLVITWFRETTFDKMRVDASFDNGETIRTFGAGPVERDGITAQSVIPFPRPATPDEVVHVRLAGLDAVVQLVFCVDGT